MALIIKDRVKEITTTTGTGDVSLGGASATFDAFQSVMSNGDTTFYAIVHTESGVDEWEVGLGTFNTGGTLSRTTVYAGSNGTSAVNFSSGNKDIFMTYPASKAAVAGEDVTFADVTATDITSTGTVTLSADPSSSLQAATKQYVDTIAAAGIHYHTPVRVEHPSNLNATYNNGSSGVGATLTNAGTNAALVLDNVNMALNDRVLVANQTDQTQNGVYTVTTVGDGTTAWVLTRSTDTDTAGPSDPDSFGKGDAFFIKEGDTNAGHLDVLTTTGTIVFGTTNIVFSEVAETSIYSAGTGLTLTGTTFSTNQDISTSASPTFNNITVTGTVDGRDVATDGSKLDGIEAGATADQTAAEIKTAYESNSNTNAFTDAEQTKLSGIETGATGDQTASEILTAIKTVDGVGSNLDADLLDGQQGSYYLNTGTTFSGDVSGTYNNIVVANDSHTHDGRYYTETEADSRFANVTGDTFTGDVVFSGNNHGGVTWDTSEDEFLFSQGSRIDFGGGANIRRENDGILRITGATADDTYFTFSNNLIFYRGGSAAAQMMTSGGTQRFHAYGNITVAGTVDGVDIAAFKTAYDSHNHDSRYYTETEADSRFVNVTGDTMTGTLTLTGSSGASRLRIEGSGPTMDFDDSDGDSFYIHVNSNNFYVLTDRDGGGDYNTWETPHPLQLEADTNIGYLFGNRMFADNYHPNADKWTTARTLSLSGDASGSVSWDGSANATLSVTVANDSHSHSNYITSNAVDYASNYIVFEDGLRVGTGTGLGASGRATIAFGEGSPTGDTFFIEYDGENLSGDANALIFRNGNSGESLRLEYGGAIKFTGTPTVSGSTMWHAGNDGSGSGLDADKLDGYHLSTTRNAANTVPVRNSSGYLDLGWINTTSGATTSTINKIYASYDDYVRYITPATFRSQVTDGSYVNVTGDTMTGELNVTHNGGATGSTAPTYSQANIEVQTSSNHAPAIGFHRGGYSAGVLYEYDGEIYSKAWITRGQDGKLLSTGNIGSHAWTSSNDGAGSGLDADLLDGLQSSSFLRSDTSQTFSGNTFTLGTSSRLTGSGWSIFAGGGTYFGSSMEINGNISSVDNIYLAGTLYHEGDTNTFVSFGTDSVAISAGGSQEITVTTTGVQLGDTGNGYFQPVSGNYGSIQIDGGAHGGWEGYGIGGRIVFMHDNNTATGIFNDVENEWIFYGHRNGYTRMYYDGSHKVETTSTGVTVTGDVNSTSDIRYKKNIETIDNALEKVQSLRGVNFDWDNDAFKEDHSTKKPNFTERATGVIAQDVEKVLPEAVRENEDGFKNVAYGNMVGLLIEAIKEQQEQIDALKKQLNG